MLHKIKLRASSVRIKSWASRIRTGECRSQSPVPYRLAIAQEGGYRDSNPGPPEPQSGALTNCAIPTIGKMITHFPTCPKGFEPPTHGLEGRCSIQLSYRLIVFQNTKLILRKAGDGNRTHVSSLEGWCSTIELHPRAQNRNRTSDTRIFSPLLYQLSYLGLSIFHLQRVYK